MKQTIFTWIVVAFLFSFSTIFSDLFLEKKSAMQGPSETAGGTIDLADGPKMKRCNMNIMEQCQHA